MKIAIDCRLYSQTGVGRYIRAILSELKNVANSQTDREYLLIIWKPDLKYFENYPENVKIIATDVKWHSFKEQLKIPQILLQNKVDLVHFPYFNVPLFYFGKYLVTIHDLTINKFKTGRASSLPRATYLIKKLFYFVTIWLAVTRAKEVLTVSETVKEEIIKKYGIDKEKIKAIYNGSELEEAEAEEKENKGDLVNRGNYILYVGNLHPHKNIETLILAYDALLKEEKFKDLKLIIVSPFDFFYKNLFNFIKKLKLERRIEFTGQVNNAALESLYKNALAFVFPSFSEGFGIPGVEAMNFGCPVVASDLPIFHEIYGDAALYFNPKNALALKEKIALAILNTSLRSKLYLSGLEQAKKYSWKKCAAQVLSEYENCARL